jgi:hypothetical protein
MQQPSVCESVCVCVSMLVANLTMVFYLCDSIWKMNCFVMTFCYEGFGNALQATHKIKIFSYHGFYFFGCSSGFFFFLIHYSCTFIFEWGIGSSLSKDTSMG